MRRFTIAAVSVAALALTACESQAEREADVAEDRIEQQAETSAQTAGDTIAALGLTERQLLDADLVTADGTDLGDVEQVRRGAGNAIEGLLVDVDNSNPDRYVVVPLTGLTTRKSGTDTDLQTTMTAEQLAALPDAQLGASAAPSAPAASGT